MSTPLTIQRGKDDLSSNAGLIALRGIFKKAEAQKALSRLFSTPRRSDAINDHDILMSMIGSIATGRSDFEAIKLFANDSVFRSGLSLTRVPSPETLRQRFDEFPARVHQNLQKLSLALIKQNTLGTISLGEQSFVPVDADVSVFDNSCANQREGVSFTYKRCNGYAPMFAYIGTEGYMLEQELREGSQHCQKHTPEFLSSLVDSLETLNLEQNILVRLDSGNDALENLEILQEAGHSFLIKRNRRKESKEQWLAVARRTGQSTPCREGKERFVGRVDHICPAGSKQPVPIYYEVIVRHSDADGIALLIPDIEVNTFWCNVYAQAEEVIQCYHDHGTSEQYHSELKTDLNVEQLPSGRFSVNALVLRCAQVAYNALRCLGQRVLQERDVLPIRTKVKRFRLSTVLKNLIYVAGKVVRHANRRTLQFGKHCPWYDCIARVALS